jgi:hypothetical protein
MCDKCEKELESVIKTGYSAAITRHGVPSGSYVMNSEKEKEWFTAWLLCGLCLEKVRLLTGPDVLDAVASDEGDLCFMCRADLILELCCQLRGGLILTGGENEKNTPATNRGVTFGDNKKQ